MGDLDRIATTGFSKMSDRQVGIWETGSLSNIKTTTIDQSSGVMMPFWSDNNILFLGTLLFFFGCYKSDMACSRKGVCEKLADNVMTD